MDIDGMYTASPDWLKLVFILAPHLTIVAVAIIATRAWREVKMRAPTLKSDSADFFQSEKCLSPERRQRHLLRGPDFSG